VFLGGRINRITTANLPPNIVQVLYHKKPEAYGQNTMVADALEMQPPFRREAIFSYSPYLRYLPSIGIYPQIFENCNFTI
jgi:hypothetical protein